MYLVYLFWLQIRSDRFQSCQKANSNTIEAGSRNESRNKREEVNMLGGALSQNVIIKCGSAIEIIFGIVEQQL